MQLHNFAMRFVEMAFGLYYSVTMEITSMEMVVQVTVMLNLIMPVWAVTRQLDQCAATLNLL
jgi:hypothetical protein